MRRNWTIAFWTFSFWIFFSSWSLSGQAASMWQRAGAKQSLDERHALLSIERVFQGRAQERDLLRVRVALISLAKGEIQDPRTVVLLVRLRRELYLSPGRFSEVRLSRALEGKLSHTLRAWAYLERAQLNFRSDRPKRGLQDLEAGLRHAWREDVRAELLVFRAWCHLRRGDSQKALNDFSRMEKLNLSKRSLLQARVGRAFAALLRGDLIGLETEAGEALEIENRRASVSARGAFWELSLSDSENEAIELLLKWARWRKKFRLDPQSDSSAFCDRLGTSGSSRAATRSSHQVEISSRLRILLERNCRP